MQAATADQTLKAGAVPADKNGAWRQIGTYTGLALMVPAAGLTGFGIGFGLDHHFGTGVIFRVVFLLLGSAAGLIEIVRVAARS